MTAPDTGTRPPRRVLIAEDEALIRLDLAEMLREEGYEVVGEAADGQEAVELAERLRPDLVIMDVKMPRRDGLDAAAEIAGERGYDGTSINLVSERSGLPVSSIYWHFKDKDDLIAAVIERSFGTWLAAWQLPDGGQPEQRIVQAAAQTAKALLESPDFIRLGLMLALERRPVEPRARTMFLSVRDQAHKEILDSIHALAPDLSDAHAHQLATYAMAGADGLFIAKEIGGDSVDLPALFAIPGQAIYDAAIRMLAEDN